MLAPLGESFAMAGLVPGQCFRWIAVSDVEGTPERSELERLTEDWEVTAHRVLRADAGYLLAGECPHCGAFHLSRSLYRIEPLAEGVALSARFAGSCPAVRLCVERGHLLGEPCELEPDAWRLAWS